jgi:plastocyanin
MRSGRVGGSISHTHSNGAALTPSRYGVLPEAGAPFDSGVFDPGRSFTVRFDQPGTYTYVCTLHPGMGGTIVVTG